MREQLSEVLQDMKGMEDILNHLQTYRLDVTGTLYNSTLEESGLTVRQTLTACAQQLRSVHILAGQIHTRDFEVE